MVKNCAVGGKTFQLGSFPRQSSKPRGSALNFAETMVIIQNVFKSNRKPWSMYRTVTSLAVSNASSS
jgi:hypothetical protein